MTRSEIIANHIDTLRNLVANSDATTARLAFVRAIYAALATPGCEAQGVRLVDLPHLAERVAEMADAHEALRAERDEARGEVATLRAQVVEYVRNGVSIHKAADAARRAERADVVAWLHTDGPALAFASCIGGSEYTCAADAIGRGEHEGAATPK